MGGPSIYEWLRHQYLEIFASISKENFDIDQIIHQHLQKQGFYFLPRVFKKITSQTFEKQNRAATYRPISKLTLPNYLLVEQTRTKKKRTERTNLN